ncbi:3-dehydroquinate synthase [Hahella sp. KA22]|nr:3-dehydroquinate synthase [Hahella sp. KA22]QAY57770.1 3-dehydroquinate synthase [Hahella sp. KA22]
MKQMTMETLQVELGDRSYPIYIGAGLLKASSYFADAIRHKQVMIVTNETIAPLYLEQLEASLEGFQVDKTILEDGEQFKNLDSLNNIFDHLLTQKHNRTTTLIALGGGVVGDMTGFAAACYQRGVDFIQAPTTLLSQVDSSVGGKTGVNHPLGKNMIGAFYQPKAVVIDTDTLKTLPAAEVSAGLAEVIKYGLIYDQAFFSWLEENIDLIKELDSAVITYAIKRSCEIKAEVVAADETEQGLRAILNLGHTFGHAIEAYTHYKEWLHGEAVAVGMLMAADLSRRMGRLNEQDCERITKLISRADLPVRPPVSMTKDDFIRYMAIDKKVLDGQLRLVLLESLGRADVTADFPADMLQETLALFTTH